MALSFRDYVLISEALAEVQLEEGKIDDLLAWVKKKLGPKATLDQIEAKLKTLKDVDAKDIAAVKKNLDSLKKTSASRDFHARKAADAVKSKTGVRTTVSTISHHSGIEDAKARLAATPSNKMRASQGRASERNWALGEEVLEESQDFVVTYKLKTGDTAKRWKVTARDSAHAKRKFSDSHYGAKLVSIEPMGGKKVAVKKVAERPGMDEDLDELED